MPASATTRHVGHRHDHEEKPAPAFTGAPAARRSLSSAYLKSSSMNSLFPSLVRQRHSPPGRQRAAERSGLVATKTDRQDLDDRVRVAFETLVVRVVIAVVEAPGA